MSVPTELDMRFRERAAAESLLDVAYDLTDSPIGTLLVASTRNGLCRIAYDAHPDAVVEELARLHGARVLRSPRRVDKARRELDEYFGGRRRDSAFGWTSRGSPASSALFWMSSRACLTARPRPTDRWRRASASRKARER